ncbi:hypothetical protein SAMN05421743_10988 [Thalassobacillus cyri]|uniref:Uncharacterized protein n=1 Tax=Thalassobacillus cyri TaxID=571932 RepID=A0A1H4EJQ8_9BACI|nr:hypothetical protein [Thalassobacillus cyri]SEA84830.1 hypothetical protein SAMN05421743_10988 [Thalassobacillus cyri]
MTILFTKGRELLEEDMKNQAFKKQPEQKQAQKKSGKATLFSKKK